MAAVVQDRTSSSSTTTSGGLGYDFALLGLPAREARVEVIRQAAGATASRIHQAAFAAAERDELITDLATSTYRLLDPRRRRKTMERVQLCIVGEADLERQQRASADFAASTTAGKGAQQRMVSAELVSRQPAGGKSAESSAVAFPKMPTVTRSSKLRREQAASQRLANLLMASVIVVMGIAIASLAIVSLGS